MEAASSAKALFKKTFEDALAILQNEQPDSQKEALVAQALRIARQRIETNSECMSKETAERQERIDLQRLEEELDTLIKNENWSGVTDLVNEVLTLSRLGNNFISVVESTPFSQGQIYHFDNVEIGKFWSVIVDAIAEDTGNNIKQAVEKTIVKNVEECSKPLVDNIEDNHRISGSFEKAIVVILQNPFLERGT